MHLRPTCSPSAAAATMMTTVALLLPLLLAPVTAAKPRDAILLSQVESITLRADRQTSHRRVPAIPQLQCIASPGVCDRHAVDLMRCENRGSGYDAEDIQWSCTAQLPPELKLGSTDVICEGYAGPDDPYVLKGSCGVEYRLALTQLGEERWGRRPAMGHHRSHSDGGGTEWLFVALFWIVFAAVALWIVYSLVQGVLSPNRPGDPRAPRRITGGGGGGGGGGGDGWDDPPPPYPGAGGGWRQPRASRSSGARKSAGSSSRTTAGGSSSRGASWQSNILSGAAGAAAGYYAGSRARNNQNSNNDIPSTAGSWWPGSTRTSGASAPSRSDSPRRSSGGGSGVSSSRYESTGFGSTSRR